MRFRFIILLFLVLALGFSPAALAHPHAWITLKTTIIVNDKGEAVAMREHWLFDKMYSAYAVRDFNPNKNGKFGPKDLQKLAEENVSNLKSFNYFTVAETSDGKKIAFGDAKDITSVLQGSDNDKDQEDAAKSMTDDIRANTKDYPPEAQAKIQAYIDAMSNRNQIAMDFTVPFQTAEGTVTHPLTYRIYDPTYYTDIEHKQPHPVTFVREKDGSEIKNCNAKVAIPKVDQNLVFSAAAIDKNGKAPEDLGYYFSEKVTLSCSLPL